jgi:hypothetical protein
VDYPLDFDLAWVAGDADDCIGVFITAGLGPMARTQFERSSEMRIDIEAELLMLPRITGCDLLVDVPAPSSYVDLAERGFFVFDWFDQNIDTYRLVAKPSSPLRSADIESDLRMLVALAKLEFFFVDCSTIGTFGGVEMLTHAE